MVICYFANLFYLNMENSGGQHFKRNLSLIDGTLIVIGSMIGSGIFIVSADITRNVGGAGWLIAVWVFAGFMTMTAAVSYGELGGMFPKAGGQYVYLKEAYGPFVAFLYGWGLFAVIQTATIAAVAIAFAKFSAYIWSMVGEDVYILTIGNFHISAAQLLAIFIIILLTWFNTRGISEGKLIQRVFTAAKLLSLFGLIIFGLFMIKPDVWAANWGSSAWEIGRGGLDEGGSWSVIPYAGMTAILGAVAAAMVGSVFSNEAWNNVTFVAGELKNPSRNIGLSLFLGTLTVTIIYVLANIMYTGVLTMEEIGTADRERVAVAAANSIFGNIGTLIIVIMIMISTFGCNNGLILAGSRVYHTMAKDGLFFKPAGKLNRNAVPEWALWAQAVVASVLCLSGKYGNLLDMISFVVVLFYVLTILGVFILRKKAPDHPRPYKAFGYPVLPLFYIVMGIAFCILLLIFKPQYTWPGFIIVGVGVPLYFIARSSLKADPVVETEEE